ncbi:MAG: hypothetical protein ACQER4_09965, partial [Bacteroidota bacterium]
MRPSGGRGRGWRVAGWLLLILLSCLILLRLALKSDRVLDRLRTLAVDQVNRQLNGEITLDRLEGDLLYGWTLYGLELRGEDGEKMGQLSRLEVGYHPVRLVTGLELDFLQIDSLSISLIEESPGEWNLMQLLPASDPDDQSDGLPFHIHELNLDNARMSVHSPSLPDDSLRIVDLALRAEAGYRSGEWDVSLGDLRMKVEEGRLPSGLEVAMAGGVQGEEVTLERLLVSSGRSWLQSQGSAVLAMDGRIDLEAGLDPLSVADLKAWNLAGLEKDVTADLRFSGSVNKPSMRLDLQAGSGLRQLRLEGEFEKIEQEYTLAALRMEVDELNGPELTGREETPSVDHLALDLSGSGSFADPLGSSLQGEAVLAGLSISGRPLLDHFRLGGEYQNHDLNLTGELQRGGETIRLEGSGSFPAESEPEWVVQLNGDQIDLQAWWPEVTQEVILNPQLEMNGRGLTLTEPVEVDLQLNESRILQESIDTLRLNGSFTRDSLSMHLFGRPLNGTIQVDLEASLQPESPDFQWAGQFDDLDIGRFFPVEQFPTRINGEVQGQGSGWSREALSLDAMIQLDSSQVNREWIETLQGEFHVRDERVLVSPLQIESSMVSGNVELDHHLIDLYDPRNRMEVDLELKNSTPFAPLAGVEDLQGSGTIRGRLYRSEEGELLYEGEGVLRDVVVGEFFQGVETTWEISGV